MPKLGLNLKLIFFILQCSGLFQGLWGLMCLSDFLRQHSMGLIS